MHELTPIEILSLIKNVAFLLETVLVYILLNVVTEPHLSHFSLEGEGEY